MRVQAFSTAILFAIAVLLSTPRETPAAQGWTIVAGKSVGWVKLGMAWSVVEKQLGMAYEVSRDEDDFVYHYSSYGLAFIVQSGRVYEIQVLKVGYRGAIYQTPEGLTVGSSLDQARRFYRVVRSSTHHYLCNGIAFSIDDEGDIISIAVTSY